MFKVNVPLLVTIHPVRHCLRMSLQALIRNIPHSSSLQQASCTIVKSVQEIEKQTMQDFQEIPDAGKDSIQDASQQALVETPGFGVRLCLFILVDVVWRLGKDICVLAGVHFLHQGREATSQDQ